MPQLLCQGANEMVNGQCVPKCGADEERKPDGTCGPKIVINPEVLQNLQLNLSP